MCFRETPFTALQQGDINDLLRVSFPVQINRVIIKLASDLFSLLTIAERMEFSNLRNILRAMCLPPALRLLCLPSPTFSLPRQLPVPLLVLLQPFPDRPPNCSSKHTARQRQALTGPPNTRLIIAASLSQRSTTSRLRTHTSSLWFKTAENWVLFKESVTPVFLDFLFGC